MPSRDHHFVDRDACRLHLNAKVANLTDIKGQFKSLEEEILREEAAANRASNAVILPYCADLESVPNPANPAGTLSGFHTIAQSHLCARYNDLLRRQDLAYESLSPPWFPPDDRALPARLNVVSGYVLPVLMGLLGSMTYVLRRYLRSVGDRLLTPRDLREYIVRLVLGTVFGVAIGFFHQHQRQRASEQVIANPVQARSGHRRWRSSPVTALKHYSECWMAWRSSSPPQRK